MNHEGLASWDHRKTFHKQAPECFCSQQAILTFTVRGRHASSQITHHRSQSSLCSRDSTLRVVKDYGIWFLNNNSHVIYSTYNTDLLNMTAQCIDTLRLSWVQDNQRQLVNNSALRGNVIQINNLIILLYYYLQMCIFLSKNLQMCCKSVCFPSQVTTLNHKIIITLFILLIWLYLKYLGGF